MMTPQLSRRLAKALNSPILQGDFTRTEKLRGECIRADTWEDLSLWARELVELTEQVVMP